MAVPDARFDLPDEILHLGDHDDYEGCRVWRLNHGFYGAFSTSDPPKNARWAVEATEGFPGDQSASPDSDLWRDILASIDQYRSAISFVVAAHGGTGMDGIRLRVCSTDKGLALYDFDTRELLGWVRSDGTYDTPDPV